MASYYTYGRMPSAEDTVYGLGGLDEDRVYIPRGEPDVILPGLSAGEGPIEEFVGTPYMPSFPMTPVAPPEDLYIERGGPEPFTPYGPLETSPGPGLAGDDGRVITQPFGAGVPINPDFSGIDPGLIPQAPPEDLYIERGGPTALIPEPSYALPEAPPEDPSSRSGPEVFRWSDGTYHYQPEETGQRTALKDLPANYQRLSEEALGGLTPQAPPEDPFGKTSGPPPPLGMKVNPNYGQPGQNYYIFEDEDVAPGYRGDNVPVSPLLSLASSGEGLMGGAEPPVFMPRGESVPVAPLATATSGSRVVPPEGYPTGTVGSMYVPGATLPEGVDPLAPMELTPEQIKGLGNAMALAGLVDPNAFGNMYVGDAAFGGGPPLDVGRYQRNVAKDSVGGQGSFYEEGALEAAKEEAKNPYSGLFGENLRELLAQDPSLQPLIEARTARGLAQIAKVEQDYDVMKPLSDLLKANKFQEAFAYAKDKGLTDRLLKADWLSQLRQPFTPEEMQQFYNAIPPDYAGGEFRFDPQGAAQRAITSIGATPQWSGYPDPQAVFVRKDDKTVENLAKIAGVAMLTAGLAPGLLGGAGGAGGAAGAGGAGAAGAGGAGLGAAGTGAAAAGVGAGAASALPTITVVGSKAAGLGLGQLLGGGALTAAGLQALAPTNAQIASQLQAAGYQPTTVPSATPVTPPVDDLAEVVVTGTKPGISKLIAPLTAAEVLKQAVPDLTQGYQPTQIGPDGAEIPPGDGLEEVVVQTTRPPLSPLTAAEILRQTVPDMMKDYKPTEVPKSPLDQIKSVLEKANTARKMANLLKSLGLLGAGAAVGTGRGTTAQTTTPTGFGGALPKYELKRTQLSPAIDYYRYGQGPEAKFFEDTLTPVETTQGPATGVVNPKDEPKFAEGGLTNYAKGGSHSPRYVAGPGSGREDKIPALLSDGEYVIDAETLALLGDGSPKEGAARMDKFRAKIRQHKGRALSRGRISPNAKSPDKYMGGGLTR